MSIKKETNRITAALFDHARKSAVTLNECFTKVTPGLEPITAPMKNPQWLQDKDMALWVCDILTRLNLESGGMEEESMMHLLSLRLYDYIKREIKQG